MLDGLIVFTRNFGFTNQESDDYAAAIFTGSVEFEQQYL